MKPSIVATGVGWHENSMKMVWWGGDPTGYGGVEQATPHALILAWHSVMRWRDDGEMMMIKPYSCRIEVLPMAALPRMPLVVPPGSLKEKLSSGELKLSCLFASAAPLSF